MYHKSSNYLKGQHESKAEEFQDFQINIGKTSSDFLQQKHQNHLFLTVSLTQGFPCSLPANKKLPYESTHKHEQSSVCPISYSMDKEGHINW